MPTDKKQPNRGVDIQKEVQDIMKRHDLSREDLASRLGVTMMTIYRWENGRNFPKSRLILREFEKLKRGLEKK
jgi:transcriptional regulator with XRE-family HTH domain